MVIPRCVYEEVAHQENGPVFDRVSLSVQKDGKDSVGSFIQGGNILLAFDFTKEIR